MTCPVLPPPFREDRSDSAPSAAAAAAFDLLRTALLAKLAVDLADPALARRAATEAESHARLLAGLDLAAPEDDMHASDVHGLTVGSLLHRLYPPPAELEERPP